MTDSIHFYVCQDNPAYKFGTETTRMQKQFRSTITSQLEVWDREFNTHLHAPSAGDRMLRPFGSGLWSHSSQPGPGAGRSTRHVRLGMEWLLTSRRRAHNPNIWKVGMCCIIFCYIANILLHNRNLFGYMAFNLMLCSICYITYAVI